MISGSLAFFAMPFIARATSLRLFSSNGSNIPRTDGIILGLPSETNPTYGKFLSFASLGHGENAPMELKPTARARST